MVRDMSSENGQGAELIEIAADWMTSAQDVPLVFANLVLVQHTSHEFYLVFGQVAMPPTTDIEVMKATESIPVNVLTRLAVSPSRMKQFIEVMQTNYERWERAQEAAGTSDSEEAEE